MRRIALILLCLVLASCDKPKNDTNPTADPKAVALLQAISGVWSAPGDGLVTIDYRDNTLRLVVGDEPKEVELGAIDTENETVNLLGRRVPDDKQAIWTLQRLWDASKTSFHLRLTNDSGQSEELGFVRKITGDDIIRLARLYAPPPPPPPPPSASSNEQLDASAKAPDTGNNNEGIGASPESVVRTFYNDLSAADGAAATMLVIPEKRTRGPFSAEEISSFYGALREPLHMTSVAVAGNNIVEVNYTYVGPSGNECVGHASVYLEQRTEGLLISRISTNGGC